MRYIIPQYIPPQPQPTQMTWVPLGQTQPQPAPQDEDHTLRNLLIVGGVGLAAWWIYKTVLITTVISKATKAVTSLVQKPEGLQK